MTTSSGEKEAQLEAQRISEGRELPTCVHSEAEPDVFISFLGSMKTVSPSLSGLKLLDKTDVAEFLVVNAKTESWARQKVEKLRSEYCNFLKPLLLVSPEIWPWLDETVDVFVRSPISQSNFETQFQKLFKISEKLSQVDEAPRSLGETGLSKLALLRFLFSRDPFVLKPQLNFKAQHGYAFPLLSMLLGSNTDEIGFLESLIEPGLLDTKLVDKVNVCPFCEHTQINFRETCPRCQSLQINEEPTVHHFRCANVARESEYMKGTELVCPKCSHKLKHIGVDYDKPSEILWCASCNHNFAEPELSCLCLACGRNFKPEDANLKSVAELSLSEEGFRAAEEGVLPGFGLLNLLKKELGFYKNEIFAEYLRIEMARCRRYKYHSTLAKFNLQAASDQLEERLIEKSRRFRRDFAAVLTETFRTSDIFTDLQSGDILIIFTNTDAENSRTAFLRLVQKIKERFDVHLKLQFSLFELANLKNSLDEIWEKLN